MTRRGSAPMAGQAAIDGPVARSTRSHGVSSGRQRTWTTSCRQEDSAAAWTRRGCRVVYVLCTDGNDGSHEPGMTRERLAEIRRAKQREACSALTKHPAPFDAIPRWPILCLCT